MSEGGLSVEDGQNCDQSQRSEQGSQFRSCTLPNKTTKMNKLIVASTKRHVFNVVTLEIGTKRMEQLLLQVHLWDPEVRVQSSRG